MRQHRKRFPGRHTDKREQGRAGVGTVYGPNTCMMPVGPVGCLVVRVQVQWVGSAPGEIRSGWDHGDECEQASQQERSIFPNGP